MHRRTRPTIALATLTALACGLAAAQTSPAAAGDTLVARVPVDTSSESSTPPAPADEPPREGLLHDARLYFTAPLRWNGGDWAWFAGAVAATAGSHHYDSQVRTHFTKGLTPAQISNINSDDLQDALPAAAVFFGTWGFAALIGDRSGHREAWTMFEAASFSTVDTYALKYLLRREGPSQTSSPNEWGKSGGKSFPSEHASASFAIGTVLAEAGGDDFRWLRRVLGYGLGIGTSYLRLKHNAHWLSDTVAGGALGIASGQFALNHAYRNRDSGFSLMPVQGGAMLTYRMELE